ncbi:MAG: hypothetical protein ACLTJ5_05485 [Clostridium sp.]
MKCYPAAKQEDSYEFPAGVNGGGLCFANCRYLKKVVYAKDSIMGQDFYECHNLTVVLPDVVVNPATEVKVILMMVSGSRLRIVQILFCREKESVYAGVCGK